MPQLKYKKKNLHVIKDHPNGGGDYFFYQIFFLFGIWYSVWFSSIFQPFLVRFSCGLVLEWTVFFNCSIKILGTAVFFRDGRKQEAKVFFFFGLSNRPHISTALQPSIRMADRIFLIIHHWAFLNHNRANEFVYLKSVI